MSICAPKGVASQVSQIVAIFFLVILGLWLFFTLRDAGNRAPIPTRVVATILVILLLGVLFVEAAGLVHFTPIPTAGNSTGKTNTTGGGMTTNGSGNSSILPVSLPHLTLPSWVGGALLLAFALAAVVLLVPKMVAGVELIVGEEDRHAPLAHAELNRPVQ